MVWGDARRKVSQGFSCFSCRCSLRPILGPIYGISKDIKQSSIYNRYSYVQLKMGPLFLPHSPEVMPCNSEPVSESLWASWVMMAGDTGRLQDGHGAQRCPILDFNKHLCVCILLYCPPKGQKRIERNFWILRFTCGTPMGSWHLQRQRMINDYLPQCPLQGVENRGRAPHSFRNTLVSCHQW